MFREVAWSNGPVLDRLLEEVERLSATLSSLVGELKSRDQKLGATLVDCARMRARLLDPSAE